MTAFVSVSLGACSPARPGRAAAGSSGSRPRRRRSGQTGGGSFLGDGTSGRSSRRATHIIVAVRTRWRAPTASLCLLRGPRGAPPRRADLRRGPAGAAGALVPLRRAAGAHGRRRGSRRGRQAGGLRALLRTDALPPRAGDRARARPCRAPRRILDLGCGTGTAGAAWALEASPGPGSRASTAAAGRWRRRAGPSPASASTAGRPAATRRRRPLPKPPAGILAAFTVNELAEEPRRRLLARLVEAAAAGLDRPRRRADLPARHPLVAGVGRGRSAPPAGARTSGASARRCPTASPSSARPPASTPAS